MISVGGLRLLRR